MDFREIRTKHRKIVTPIPVPESIEIIKELERYEPRSMGGQLPVVWDRAEGYQVFDPYGNCWIDFTSCIMLANVGHAHEKICRAVNEQINRKLLHNYCFPSKIRARLVHLLVDLSPAYLDKVFLLTTGSETVECSIKLARMYGRRIGAKKIGIVSFSNAFHGRTLGSQMVGGFAGQKEWIVNLDPDIHQIPFPDCFDCPWGRENYEDCGVECFERGINQLKDKGIGTDRIAGFITESYQGPTVAFLPEDYVKAMRRWADKHQALLIFDEVQAGFGRTGKMFGFEHYGVKADMICCGKGISSSLPLSAVISRAEILDIPEPGDMSSTHGGNPVCCAAALANLEVLKSEGLIERAVTVGRVLKDRLTEVQSQYSGCVGLINGKGLVYGFYLVKPGTKQLDIELARKVTGRSLEKGLMMLQTNRGTLKIVPPLCIPEDAVVEGVGVIAESIGECMRG